MTVASGRAGTFRWDAGRVLMLITLCTGQLIASIDVTVVNVALPAISSGVGLDHADLQWAVSAYAVLFGGCLLLGDRCADLLGMRRVFMAGVTLFTPASLACGLAGNGTALVVARAAQGLAAAFIAPAALGMLAAAFPEGPPRARALGIWGAVTGVSASLGVVVGACRRPGPAGAGSSSSTFRSGRFCSPPPPAGSRLDGSHGLQANWMPAGRPG